MPLYKHGHAAGKNGTKTYGIWHSMLTRCRNPNMPAFESYGGRGIIVCEAWLEFEAFLADMGECPEGMSIERVDNDKGYSPDNCKWATKKEQARNRRNSAMIEYKGKRQCVQTWAEELGFTVACLGQRFRNGWDAERALTQPQRKRAK